MASTDSGETVEQKIKRVLDEDEWRTSEEVVNSVRSGRTSTIRNELYRMARNEDGIDRREVDRGHTNYEYRLL